MVWCIMNDYNYDEGKKATLDEKFPYFEWVFFKSSEMKIVPFVSNNVTYNFFRISAVTEDENLIPEDSLNKVASKTESEPRLIKTHLSFDMLPDSITDENNGVKVHT